MREKEYRYLFIIIKYILKNSTKINLYIFIFYKNSLALCFILITYIT